MRKRKSSGRQNSKRRRVGDPKRPRRSSSISIKERVIDARKFETREIEPLKSEKGAQKWWDLEPYKGEQKWTQLNHNGVVFAPPYEQHHIKMLYDGKTHFFPVFYRSFSVCLRLF